MYMMESIFATLDCLNDDRLDHQSLSEIQAFILYFCWYSVNYINFLWFLGHTFSKWNLYNSWLLKLDWKLLNVNMSTEEQ